MTVHSLRVTALTTARERGADIIDHQDFAGHSDHQTTLIYIRSCDHLSKRPASLQNSGPNETIQSLTTKKPSLTETHSAVGSRLDRIGALSPKSQRSLDLDTYTLMDALIHLFVAAVLGYSGHHLQDALRRYLARRRRVLSYDDVHAQLRDKAPLIQAAMPQLDIILGIGRGGSIVAGMLGHMLKSDGRPSRVVSWDVEEGENRRIIPTFYDFGGATVLVTTAEDYTGRSLNKVTKLLNTGQYAPPGQKPSPPKLIKTLTVYSIHCSQRKHLSYPLPDTSDLYPLPDYTCCECLDGNGWVMPWK